MQAIETNALFTDVTVEESATVSGGTDYKKDGTYVNFDLNGYLFILGAGVVFGNPGLTPDETQFAFESAIHLG
ncbi:hypothetical protein GS682_27560 [Nostoc sp. B(2019)]|nr:hypothetical protein [Nostoc sp. B(2019)]